MLDSRNYKFVNHFKEQLERRETKEVKLLLSQDSFLDNLLYKKSFNNNRSKLIIQQIEINERTVFVFKIVYSHGREYNELTRDPRKWLNNHPLSNAELEKIKENLPPENPPPPPPPPLPEELKCWLEKPKLDLDVTIYESEDWVSNTNQRFRQYWQTYKELIREIVDNEADIKQIDNYDIFLANKENCYILFKPIIENSSSSDTSNFRKIYFLFSHFYGEPPSKQDLEKMLNQFPNFINIDEMLPYARRAYPDWVLLNLEEDRDFDLWCEIEGIHRYHDPNKFDPANLALSGEEEKLLIKSTLPLFINGQAGSGKSTMLMYLFALYSSRKIKDPERFAGSPLFLTYNEYLLNEAKQGVISILKRNPRYELRPEDKYNLESTLNEMLWPFQEFIRIKILSPELSETEYHPNKHLTFSMFKQLYTNQLVHPNLTRYCCRLRERTQYSADLVWHTIRTFIKGYSSKSEEVTPEEYSAIPQKDKSVEDGIYKDIFNSIYLQWYKPLITEHGFWDDLDLIRKAINVLQDPISYDINQYPVIFCDETQDYTKIELEFLLKLSSFTQFDLQEVNFLPFAFAGDALQTINPTGFSWRRLKSDFHSKFTELYRGNITLCDGDLRKNYRSVPEIVKLANLIQFCRYKLLTREPSQDLEPQDWWRQPSNIYPCKFILGENFSVENLKLAEDTTIIVPTELGEEEKFHKTDDALKEFIGKEHNIYSPARAKGLEFPKVIIYKFGESVGDLFSKALQKIKSGEEIDESSYIRLAYFFNKLYVAITRAQNSLFIIDSKAGEANLWKYLTQDSPDNIYGRANEEDRGNWPESKIGYVVWATNDQIIELIEEDPISKAEELAKKGRRQRNSDYLRRASSHYEEAGREEEKNVCLAEAYEIDNQWELAGDLWIRIQQYERASECFWKGLCWEQLIKLHEKVFGLDQSRAKVAKFMLSTENEIEVLRETILDPEVISRISPREKTWEYVIEQIKVSLNKALKQNRNDWGLIASGVEQVILRGFEHRELYDLLAQYFFKGKNWYKAVEYWEKIDSISPQYYWAKAFASSLPDEQIYWLIQLPVGSKHENIVADQQILATWQRIDKIEDEELPNLIAYYFYKAGNWAKAIRFWDIINKREHSEYLWSKYYVSKNNTERIKWLLRVSNRERDKKTIDIVLDLWEKIRKDSRSLNRFKEQKIKYRLIEILKDLEKYEDIYILVKDCKEPEDWKEIIQLINDNYISENEKHNVISAIAHSSWSESEFRRKLNNLRGIEREKLSSFIKKEFDHVILSDLSELDSMKLCEICCAVERIVSQPRLIDLLSVYEHIINKKEDAPFSLIKWAQKRWLAVKERKIIIDKKTAERLKAEDKNTEALGIKEAVDKAQKEIELKKQEWRIENYSKFPEPVPSLVEWREILDELANYISLKHSKERILVKKIQRLQKERDYELIASDWSELKYYLQKIKDEYVKELIDTIDPLIQI